MSFHLISHFVHGCPCGSQRPGDMPKGAGFTVRQQKKNHRGSLEGSLNDKHTAVHEGQGEAGGLEKTHSVVAGSRTRGALLALAARRGLGSVCEQLRGEGRWSGEEGGWGERPARQMMEAASSEKGKTRGRREEEARATTVSVSVGDA